MLKYVRNGWMDWKQLRLVHVHLKFHLRYRTYVPYNNYMYVVVLISFWFEIFLN